MSNHRLPGFSRHNGIWQPAGKTLMKRIIILATCYSLLVTLVGCESVAQKFIRKPKKKDMEDEIVLVPKDYSSIKVPVEERYRQNFVFWKSWQEELVVSLDSSDSYKKRISCISEAIKNLERNRPLLSREKQKDLDAYLDKLRDLHNSISKDIYGGNSISHKNKAEVLKRDILRDFSYLAIKEYLR